jgi:hypothetical protein
MAKPNYAFDKRQKEIAKKKKKDDKRLQKAGVNENKAQDTEQSADHDDKTAADSST